MAAGAAFRVYSRKKTVSRAQLHHHTVPAEKSRIARQELEKSSKYHSSMPIELVEQLFGWLKRVRGCVFDGTVSSGSSAERRGEETYRSDPASSRDSADRAGRLANSSAEHIKGGI